MWTNNGIDWLSGMLGQGVNAAQQQNYYGSANGIANAGSGQLANMQAQAQIATLQRQYQQAQMGAYTKPQWVIDGRAVSFQEFTDVLFPEDTPEKTVFLLRYAK